MYDREYYGRTHTLEASGGLINASLIMRDDETNSYWSIMAKEIIGGELKGTRMVELPYGEKMQWKDWVKKYPQTQALSVKGREDAPEGYGNYFNGPDGFRGLKAKDKRLKTKDPIFAFHFEGKPYAIPYKEFENGNAFTIGDAKIFLYRPKKTEIFESTAAFITRGSGFEKEDDRWIDIDSDCEYDPESKSFKGEPENCPRRLDGFDTFWYNWSLNNEGIELLGTE